MGSRYFVTHNVNGNGVWSEITILIDVSSFSASEWKGDVAEHVKEAVSFQISRGAVTKRKLLRLGVEPYLGRVKWTYLFFDSTTSCPKTHHHSSGMVGQSSMKKLSYECWELFKEKFNEQVRRSKRPSLSPPPDGGIPELSRIKNVVDVLGNLTFPCAIPDGLRKSNPDLTSSRAKSQDLEKMPSPCEKIIIVYTRVPKIFSSLVHLAVGVSRCRSSLSVAANCAPADIQICFVDVSFDSVPGPEQSGAEVGDLTCFWDDVCANEATSLHSSSLKATSFPGGNMSLRVACLKKIMMIHKLVEMRFPWMYVHSPQLGLGPGMKMLRQWDWRIPATNKQIVTRNGCLSSLRKCYSEDIYYD